MNDCFIRSKKFFRLSDLKDHFPKDDYCQSNNIFSCKQNCKTIKDCFTTVDNSQNSAILKSHSTELNLHKNNFRVCGMDEVGRGCWAGPVVGCCVEIDYDKWLKLSDDEKSLFVDSKKLNYNKRLQAKKLILYCAKQYKISSISADKIDQIGISKASLLAMKNSFLKLKDYKNINLIITDGNQKALNGNNNFNINLIELAITKADNQFICVASASILAKIYRDQLMARLGNVFKKYKVYEFASHVGYGTKIHQQKLIAHGVSNIHRKSYKPIEKMIFNKG